MRVLVAEDDAVSRHLLATFLTKWGYRVVVATDGSEAWEKLQREDAPKLAILDWMMPGMDGLALCQKIRQRSQDKYIYVLLLTAKGQKEDLVSALDAGADDYLTKPFDPQELRARVRAGWRIIELHQELIAAREQLRVEATHDALTGLWNRAAILEILHRELARAERQENTLAVIMVDLDHFKNVNDTYGHLAGDAVLREAARRMRASTRIYDEIGRYGGEEFVAVAPGCDVSSALNLAERIRATIGEDTIDTFDAPIPVTASLGVAMNGEGRDAGSLIRAADAALYKAKNTGRNRIEVAA